MENQKITAPQALKENKGTIRSGGKPAKKGKKTEKVIAELILDEPSPEEQVENDGLDEGGEFSADDLFEQDDFQEGLENELAPTMSVDGVFEKGHDLQALPAPEYDPRRLPELADSGTARLRDNLHLYLKEISRFPLLQPDEETNLARRVRENGDPDAAFHLVSSHLRLVVRIAMDFQRRWMQNVLDLIQEGNVGLVRAVSKFDPEKGIKFSYYAAFWIKAYILKFIMDNWRMVKIGTTQAQRKLFYNLNKERQRLISQGFDPDAAALSKSLNVTEDQIVEMEQRMNATDMSLNLPMNTDEPSGSTRMDYLPALGPGIEDILVDGEISGIVRERLQSLVPRLSEKEQYILYSRLLTDDPVTLREIGEKYAITRERVRQIEARLLQKIRDHLFKNIKDFSEDWINSR
jgi:RNA polymerase sigma-32 factor